MTEDRTSGPEETGSVEEPVSEGPPPETETEADQGTDQADAADVVEGEVVEDEASAESADDEPTEVRIKPDASEDAAAADEDVEAEDASDAPQDDQDEPTDRSDSTASDTESGPESAEESGKGKDDKVPAAIQRINELTDDLQRLQAEYANYRKRVDRDRELVAQNAVYKVLAPIVEVLDTIDRAREHGEVEGGFKAVADQLEQIVTKLGLTRFGEPGDVFDPTLHEALSHMGTDAEVEETTVKIVAKAGYKIGDRVVRAAQVLVVDPE